ncbi:MAG TPA: hypothetical protein VGO09_00705 [Flavisolibacter sp.]|jgi:hypothetical protein|nr:hypothetical protein [Flavisolibacter sp.]
MTYSLTGTKHRISLDAAIKMTRTFRAKKKDIIAESFRTQNILPDAETFDRIIFDQLLALPGCVGLRIYYGLDDKDEMHAIIVGVSADNEDILPTGPSTNVTIGEEGRTCPPFCSPASPLNQ